MYILFNFSCYADPIAVRVSSETIALYTEYKTRRTRGLWICGVVALISLCFFVNLIISITMGNESGQNYLFWFLLVSCTAIIGFTFYLIWRKPYACLLYSCLNSAGFREYLESFQERLNCRLEYKTAIATLLNQKEAQKIYKILNNIQKLLELMEVCEGAPLVEALPAILSVRHIDECYIKEFTYE